MPDGREVAFAGGVVDTDYIADENLRRQVETELKKVANVPSSQIYTTSAPIAPREEGEIRREVMQRAVGAFDEANKIPQGTQTQEIPMQPDPKPTLSQTHMQEQAPQAQPQISKKVEGDALALATAAAKAAIAAGKQPASGSFGAGPSKQ